MSVKLYDDAIMRKFTALLKDDRIKIMSPEDTMAFFRIVLDEQKDAPITLPLITLTRGNDIGLEYPHKKMMTFDGFMLESNEHKTLQLDAIPMTLTYQIDIYTKQEYEADAYARSFVFDLVNHPKVKVIIPYNNVNYPHISTIRLLPTIEDNSDVPNRLIHDQFTRWSIGFTIDDAYFFSLPYVDNVSIGETEIECEETLG